MSGPPAPPPTPVAPVAPAALLQLPPLRCTWKAQPLSGSSSPSEPSSSMDSDMPISWISDHTELGPRDPARSVYRVEPRSSRISRTTVESWDSPKSLNHLRTFPGTAMVIEGSPSSWGSDGDEGDSFEASVEGVTCQHPPKRPVKAWPEGVTKPWPPRRPVLQAALRQALRWAQGDGVFRR
ncbi:unnamed protein product [Durusdinium trenchii]|uniref:Uncharacterized protein n=1 Tax=Durusdinium trenchii TaxID=1381693 RepID=A0ABP0NJJ0_9DINO